MIAYGQQVTKKETIIFISVFAATALFASLKIFPLAWSILFPMLIWAAITDIKQRIIPNSACVTLILLGVYLDPSNAAYGLMGCFVAAVFMFMLGGVGGGDVKLAAGIGAALGYAGGVSVLLYSIMIASIYIIATKIFKKEVKSFIGDMIFSIRTGQFKMETPTDPQELMKKTIPLGAFFPLGVMVYIFRGGLF